MTVTDGQTDIVTSWAPDGAKKYIIEHKLEMKIHLETSSPLEILQNGH